MKRNILLEKTVFWITAFLVIIGISELSVVCKLHWGLSGILGVPVGWYGPVIYDKYFRP